MAPGHSNNYHRIARPDWLTSEIWPYEVRTVDIDEETAIAYTDEGSGSVILLVHDGMNSYIWGRLIGRLIPRFRVVSLDFPGTGLSPVTAASPGLASDSALLEEFVDAIGLESFTLAVHDLGGPVGLGLAGRRPEQVEGMTLINTFAWPPESHALRGMLRLMGSRPLAALNRRTNFLAWASSKKFGVGRHLDSDERAAFVKLFDRNESRQRFHSVMAAAAREEAYLRDVADSLDVLDDKPVLTVFGQRNDPFHFQRRWLHTFPEAQQLVIPGGYHFPMCDAPDLVARTIVEWHIARVVQSTH